MHGSAVVAQPPQSPVARIASDPLGPTPHSPPHVTVLPRRIRPTALPHIRPGHQLASSQRCSADQERSARQELDPADAVPAAATLGGCWAGGSSGH